MRLIAATKSLHINKEPNVFQLEEMVTDLRCRYFNSRMRWCVYISLHDSATINIAGSNGGVGRPWIGRNAGHEGCRRNNHGQRRSNHAHEWLKEEGHGRRNRASVSESGVGVFGHAEVKTSAKGEEIGCL